MIEKSSAINNKKLTLDAIIDAIKELKTHEIFDLTELLKKQFNITADLNEGSFVNSAKATENEPAAEVANNVSLQIKGLIQQEGLNTIKAYKEVADVSKNLGNDINIIQAKKLVEEKAMLSTNVELKKAKEIQEQLKSKGVEIAFV